MDDVKDRVELLKGGDILYKIVDFGVIEVVIKEVIDGVAYGSSRPWKRIILENGQRLIFKGGQPSRNYFLSREEAEAEIKYRGKIAKKKQLMYEYECKLNKEMDLTDYLINY